MKKDKILYTPEQIAERIKTLAAELRPHCGKNPLYLPVMMGAFHFVSDLTRELAIDGAELDYIHLKSYEGEAGGDVRVIYFPEPAKVIGRTVVVLDDIIDRGNTALMVKQLLGSLPEKVIFVCLLDKKSKRQVSMEADFVGFVIDDMFVYGYGLDLDETHRSLSDIRVKNTG